MDVTDEMVEAALKHHYGGNKWHDDCRRQMRSTLEAALAAAPQVERRPVQEYASIPGTNVRVRLKVSK